MKDGKLTEQDVDHLTSAIYCFIHATERCLLEVERYHEQILHDSAEYKKLKATRGKLFADDWIKTESKKIIKGAEKESLSRWCETANMLIARTQRCTELGIMLDNEGNESSELFDSLLYDSNHVVQDYLIKANVVDKDLIERFNPKV